MRRRSSFGEEWGQEPPHIARALLRMFKAGKFDPPAGWDTYPVEQLLNPNIPERNKPQYGYGWAIISQDNMGMMRIDSQCEDTSFVSEMQVGKRGDFGDRLFVPRD